MLARVVGSSAPHQPMVTRRRTHRLRQFRDQASSALSPHVDTARRLLSGAPEVPEVRRVFLEHPEVPRQWDGLTLLQISDVHAGPYMPPSRMRKIREMVERLPVDLIVFTGDQVDRRPSDAATFVKGFYGISAPLGVYGILGNHDHYIDPALSRWALEKAGITPLINQTVRMKAGGSWLGITGLEDLMATTDRYPDFGEIRRTEADFKVCLSHQPQGFEQASAAGAQITLSGHTHGGQIAFPSRRVNVARFHSRYVAGPYEADDALLYVSRGIGVGAVPWRVGSPPELDLITVQRATAVTSKVA
jgi:hypothetical protein